LTSLLDGSGERVLVSYKPPERIDPERVAWSPDGKTLAFFYNSPWPVLATIEAEGGPVQRVAGGHWDQVRDLTWLPGSRRLVVAGFPPGASASEHISLYEVSLEGGETRKITHELSTFQRVRASADGRVLLALQYQILTAIQVATPGKESEALSLSAGDQDRDGVNGLAWAPGGKIVYYSDSNGGPDLWQMGADGSNPHRLSSNGGFKLLLQPAVSLRDGFIALIQWRSGQDINIWRIDKDGSNLKQLTKGKLDFNPAISPDGRWVVFSRAESGKHFLMKVPSEGGPASQLTDYNSASATVSPNGKWIACRYLLTENQPATLAIVPFTGGQPAKVFPLPVTASYPLHWTPDGRAISFRNSVNGVDNIWEQPLEGGPPKAVTHFTSDKIFWFDWSQDGRLALSRGTEPTDAVLIKNFQ
jgi:Tol biopolymer transport system component